MKKLRFAIAGTGFWSHYQVSAWMELEGVELVALYNRTAAKAHALAQKFNVPRVYDNLDALLQHETIDFIDIITDVDTHQEMTMKAAQRGIAVICQKPMAPSLSAAQQMLSTCSQRSVPFFIHENWRWQSPMRRLQALLQHAPIGRLFKARVTFCSAFPVFDNQPFLRELEQFILTDIGSHILDVCRFLFGEADTIYCQTASVNPGIKGEDVANVMMAMKSGVSCFAEMSYASVLEREAFPQTFVLIEGEHGSIQLTHDHEIRVTTRQGTSTQHAHPPSYPWLDPKYALVHASIVDCNRNILGALQGTSPAETTGSDNFQTVRLVHAAYQSAATRKVIHMDRF